MLIIAVTQKKIGDYSVMLPISESIDYVCVVEKAILLCDIITKYIKM